MTIGLSLLSYIGTQALGAYEQDYSNWSLVQSLVEYFDEKAEVRLDGTTLAITFDTADFLPMPKRRDQPQKVLPISDPPKKSDPAPDITWNVPQEQVQRIKAILAASEPTAPVVDFRFACKPLVIMFASAQGKSPPPDNQSVLPGGVSVDDCVNHLFNAVPPRVIAVADDLASTYSNVLNERDVLDRVNEIILTPVRLFEVLVVRPSEWTYNGLRHILSGTAGPDKRDPVDKPNFVLSPEAAFNLFVLQQQHHTPLPRVLPIPPPTAGGPMTGRLAVAITNTYLLTLSFGFLGACVWVLREINLRLENFTLAPSQFPRYRARILLGMVAGPTIGLFFNEGHLLSFTTTSTDVANLSTQLSASAIAFVAGFSIEILFAILDRLIRIVQEFAGADSSHRPTAR